MYQMWFEPTIPVLHWSPNTFLAFQTLRRSVVYIKLISLVKETLFFKQRIIYITINFEKLVVMKMTKRFPAIYEARNFVRVQSAPWWTHVPLRNMWRGVSSRPTLKLKDHFLRLSVNAYSVPSSNAIENIKRPFPILATWGRSVPWRWQAH